MGRRVRESGESRWPANQSAPTRAANPPPAYGAARAIQAGQICGDGTCNFGETCLSCPVDCGECDPPIVQAVAVDSTSPNNPAGTKSCQIQLHINPPGERLILVDAADVVTSDPAGFFQHPFGTASGTSPPCAFLPLFPDLAHDSYVTIGVACDDLTDSTVITPDFSPAIFNTGGGVVGGWFNSLPPNGQGDPDGDGNILVAQFTMNEEENVCGTVTAFVQGDFGLPPLLLECPDLDGGGDVGAFDLALLGGAWGACPEPCTPGDPATTCVADFNGDCLVNGIDLSLMMGGWGRSRLNRLGRRGTIEASGSIDGTYRRVSNQEVA